MTSRWPVLLCFKRPLTSMLRLDGHPCYALLLAGTLNLLLWCPPVLAVNPSQDISQYAHTARTVRDRSFLGNTRDDVPIRLPLIEGKDIRFTHYSTEQGLSENRVDHMLQDAQGFLWFGTYNGLDRFDGYHFLVYKPEANNPNSLGGVMIYSLFQDRSGALWIAVDQGLDRFDPISQKFTHFYSNASDPGSPSGHVEHITQDRDGMLWLATREGLDRLDPASLRFTHYRNNPNDPHSLASNDTRYVLEDRQGTLWVATAAGPDAFDRRAGKVIRHYPSSWQPPLDRIYEDRSGTLWLSATRRGGLTSLDRKTGVFTTYIFFDQWPEVPGTRGCSAILEDHHGMLWLGTKPDGVVKFDRQRREFTRYRNEPGYPTSLNSNEAISLVEDREGGIWVGTATGGVNRFPSEPTPFTIYRSKPGSTSGLDQDSVVSVFKDSQGILWIATRELIQLDRKTGRYTFYRHDPANPGSISADIVSATIEDRAGFLWVGTWGGGLNRFDRRTGRFKVYRHDPANSASLSNDFIMYLLLDREGNVWAGTEDGVNRLDARTGRFTVFRFPGQRDSRMYPALTQDVDGSIWMGTYEQGLQHLDVQSGKIVAYVHNPKVRGSLSNNRVNDLYVDHSGTLWVATQDGLDRFDRNTGEFTDFNERDGLANNAAVGLQEDRAGYLWVATTSGLSKFDPQSGSFKNYYASDGLAGNEFENTHVHFKSADGEMLFTGWKGITAFYPDRVVERPYVPPVIFTDFRLFNKPVLPGEKSVLRKSISYTDALTLSHRQNIFSIEFSSLSYANPQRNRYRYMLEPLEKTWNEVGSEQRWVTYTTLPPGRYTFRVQGSSSSGVWNVKGVSVALTILPAWYQTMWFRVLSAAALLALLWAAYQLRVRSIEKRHRELELAAEKLQRSEAYLSAAERASETGSFGWSVSSGEIYWSEETFRIFQYDPATKPTMELVLQRVHPDDVPLWKQDIKRASQGGNDYGHEYRLLMPDGSVKYLQIAAHAQRDRSGELEFIGAVTDVTAAKRAQEKLRQSEEELRQLVDVIPQQVFVFDVDWSPVFANRRELDYTGLTSQEMQSKDAVARIFHPEDLKKLEVARERARSDGAPFEMEARIRGKDGGYRWFLIRDNPLCDEQGHVLRWYSTRTDIEDRKRAEEARSKAQADLAHVNRVSMMGELAASIAHEVNQPLSGVVSNGGACLRWLAGDVPSLEEAREAARRIVRDGKRAGEVIARIRALTRRAEVPRKQLDLNETIRQVIVLVGDEAKRNTVVIRTRFGDDVFPVLGDQVQLQQVVLNLVMNAIEAMSKVGDRARELVITTRNIDPEQVQVTVEDSGTGIDPQMIDKVFDSFYTTKSGGMGMGLSVSRSILQAHGGRLWATAKDGAGTIFHFTLPKYHEESNAGITTEASDSVPSSPPLL